MKTSAPGQPQLQRGERPSSYIPKLVVRLDANPGIRPGQELHANFLILDGVARPERDGAGRNPKTYWGEKQTEKRAKMRARRQSDSIVTGEIGRSKRENLVRGAAGNNGRQPGLRPRTRTKDVSL